MLKMHSIVGEKVCCEKGNALAEAAITMPLLLLLSCVIIQLALLFNTKLVVNYAAFCAARAVLVYGSDQARDKAEKAAWLACAAISYPVSQDIKVLAGFGDIESADMPDLSGLGQAGDLVERYIGSCLRTKVSIIANSKDSVCAEVKHHTRLLFPIGALARLVAGSRYQVPYVDLPDEVTSTVNKLETWQDKLTEFTVPVVARCTLRK
jgi:hypothetical protein